MKNKFEIKSGKIIIADPCHTSDDKEINILENIKKGSWIAEVNYADGYDGTRVGKLITKHCDFDNYDWCDKEMVPLTIDSLDIMVGIFDEKYYDTPDGIPLDYKPETEVVDENGKVDLFFSFCYEKTSFPEKYGVLPYGVVIDVPNEVNSYKCFIVSNENNEIVVIEIIIYEDSEYEYEEGCFGDWDIDCECPYCEQQRELENNN